tara:strand:+ start:379 stop:516 length:138 start_codon:yes stop_codon:yes gene_type:complete
MGQMELGWIERQRLVGFAGQLCVYDIVTLKLASGQRMIIRLGHRW